MSQPKVSVNSKATPPIYQYCCCYHSKHGKHCGVMCHGNGKSWYLWVTLVSVPTFQAPQHPKKATMMKNAAITRNA